MSGSLNESQAKVIQYLLIDLGHGSNPVDAAAWPIIAYNEPDKPDDCITIFDTAGLKHGKTNPDSEVQEHHGIQVRVRSMNGRTGRSKARTIAVALDQVKLKSVSIGSDQYVVHAISRRGDVIPLGKEPESRRNLFTVNVLVALRQTG